MEKFSINKTEKENFKAELEKIAQELEKTLPENQANTRSETTKSLLDFAAKIYQVEPYNEGLESGKYITWLQNLGFDAYEASMKLNSPKKCLETLMKYVSSIK